MGRAAGKADHRGYLYVHITFEGKGNLFLGHRIAMALATGSWPADEVDHENGIPGDNRFSNLRCGTHAENGQNTKLSRANTSGYTGVTWDKRRRKWMAKIVVDGRWRFQGHSPTRELAYAAYLAAKARYHPYQPVPRAA